MCWRLRTRLLGAAALIAGSLPGYAAARSRVPGQVRPGADQTPIVACSFDRPVCVHAPTAVRAPAISSTLHAAEHALSVFQAMGLPPLDDGGMGGGPALDLYLMRGAAPVTSFDLVPAVGTYDSAPAFVVLPPPGVGRGCVEASEVARAVAQAIVLRMDAGIEEATLAMASSYLASLAVPCGVAELAAIDDFQRRPERDLAEARAGALDGSLLFPMFLDDRYGTGRPAGVITGLVAVSGQRADAGALEWGREPDVFDALRVAAKARDTTAGDLLLEFAIARAFAGSRSDGVHFSDATRYGDMGRVRFEWNVPYASLPRRLAPLRPIGATGATYLWVDLAGAPPGTELTFVADWELPVLFHWALVKVDAQGTEAGRVTVAAIYGSTHAERTVVGLDGLAGLLVVGVNQGDIDRANPYDPDDAPYEPHGYTVTLAK
jgi:hypothetical protein